MAPATTTGGTIRAGIDRKKENELVLLFQKNPNNGHIFELIYEPRKPTIQHLSQRFAYVAEDIKSEITVVFLRSMKNFRRSRRDFNTFFYTNVLNHIRNMIKAKKRQKRTLLDGSDPALSSVSLDQELNDGERCVHEVIPSSSNVLSGVTVSEMIECVKEDSKILYDIMVEIASYGSPCIKRRTYSGSIRFRKYESDEEAIARDVGIPEDLYTIETCSRSRTRVSYTVSVSGQKAVRYLSSYLRNKGFAK